MIRLAVPSIEEDDLQAVREALASGFLIQGPRVAAFENIVAAYVGTRHAVAVSNCTAALHLSLLALGIKSDDLVLVTAYSWLSTANVIELCGAKPIFVDIDAKTFNIDANQLEQKMVRLMSRPETRGRVKAILPVHAFGQLADMAAIKGIADRFEVPVIEDAACALGARLKGTQAGTWGELGCFSFHPRKAITTGEGGMITTNSSSLAEKLRTLRNHGQDSNSISTDFIRPGLNYRMTEFQAALGLSQMRKLDRIVSARRRVAGIYDDLLRDTLIQAPHVPESSLPVYQSYVTLLPNNLFQYRDELIRHLKKKEIETTIGTWHMPMTTYYRNRYGFKKGDFPVADRVFAASLTLPVYEKLSESDQRVVVHEILEFNITDATTN